MRLCHELKYWILQWYHKKEPSSFRHLRWLLHHYPAEEAIEVLLVCAGRDMSSELLETIPLLAEAVYEWKRKPNGRSRKRTWYFLRRFIRRRLSHHSLRIRKAALGAVDEAFCYTAADKQRLFLQNILHPQEDIWLTIVDWAEYVAWRDLISLLLQETPWRHGTAWNVLFALDNWVIDYMDESQKQELLDALKRVLLYVDGLCLTQRIDRMALWKLCETIGFHIRGEYAEHILREVTKRCQSVAVFRACWNAIEDYFEVDEPVS